MLNRRLSATKTIYRRENEVSSPKEKKLAKLFRIFRDNWCVVTRSRSVETSSLSSVQCDTLTDTPLTDNTPNAKGVGRI